MGYLAWIVITNRIICLINLCWAFFCIHFVLSFFFFLLFFFSPSTNPTQTQNNKQKWWSQRDSYPPPLLSVHHLFHVHYPYFHVRFLVSWKKKTQKTTKRICFSFLFIFILFVLFVLFYKKWKRIPTTWKVFLSSTFELVSSI